MLSISILIRKKTKEMVTCYWFLKEIFKSYLTKLSQNNQSFDGQIITTRTGAYIHKLATSKQMYQMGPLF
jgi:hypothetical protein